MRSIGGVAALHVTVFVTDMDKLLSVAEKS